MTVQQVQDLDSFCLLVAGKKLTTYQKRYLLAEPPRKPPRDCVIVGDCGRIIDDCEGVKITASQPYRILS